MFLRRKARSFSAVLAPLGLVCIWCLALSACSSDATPQSSASDKPDAVQTTDSTGSTPDVSSPADTSTNAPVFTHKMMKKTNENMFASLAYDCPQCTFEQWLAIVPPEGWSKGPAQVLVADGGEMRSTPSFDGVPSTMDFIEEVPGEEYQLIAKNLDGRLIPSTGAGLVVEAQVQRDNFFTYDAGTRVHELTDPDGNVFILFAYQVDPTNVVIPDFQDPNVLKDFTPPDNWTYTSRVLDQLLLVDTTGVATVLAIRGEITSTWEKL